MRRLLLPAALVLAACGGPEPIRHVYPRCLWSALPPEAQQQKCDALQHVCGTLDTAALEACLTDREATPEMTAWARSSGEPIQVWCACLL